MSAEIRTPSDLTDATAQLMMREFYSDAELTAKLAGGLSAMGGGDANDHYHSDIKTIEVAVQRKGREEETLHMLFKLPVSGFMGQMHKIARPLMREVSWYTRAAPALARRSPALAELLPRCYHGFSVHAGRAAPTACERVCCLPCWFPFRRPDHGLLLLENLTRAADGRSFSTVDKHAVMGLAHVRLALRALATYHGAWWRFLHEDLGHCTAAVHHSLARREALLLYDTKFPELMLKDMINKTFKSVLVLLKNRGESEELLAKVRRYGKEKAVRRVSDYLCRPGSEKSKLSIITHGDFWSNNMMFAHDESSGEPTAVKLIDFQMMGRGHPAIDICYLLHINTDAEFRRKHLDDLLKEYFAVLAEYFGKSCDMTFQQFQQEFQTRRDIGLVLGLLVMPNVTSPNERKFEKFSDFQKVNRQRHEEIASPDRDDDHPSIREIRRRIVDMIREYDGLGILG